MVFCLFKISLLLLCVYYMPTLAYKFILPAEHDGYRSDANLPLAQMVLQWNSLLPCRLSVLLDCKQSCSNINKYSSAGTNHSTLNISSYQLICQPQWLYNTIIYICKSLPEVVHFSNVKVFFAPLERILNPNFSICLSPK